MVLESAAKGRAARATCFDERTAEIIVKYMCCWRLEKEERREERRGEECVRKKKKREGGGEVRESDGGVSVGRREMDSKEKKGKERRGHTRRGYWYCFRLFTSAQKND